MKLPFVFGVDDLRLVDVDRPSAGARDVVIRVASAGICGSDLNAVKMGGTGGSGGDPVPLGHELSGTVTEVGAEVTSYSTGDRVILNPLCNLVGNGGPEGGFAELLLIRDIVGTPGSLLRIPDDMSFDTGALVEPVAVGIHAINRAEAKAGDKIALFGAGPIGLGIVLALHARGIEDIIVFDLSAFRRERALQLGARAAYDPRENPPISVLGAHHGETLLYGFMPAVETDIFIEASGAPSVIPEIIGMAKVGARLAVVAGHKKPVEVDFMSMLAREMSIVTAMGYPTELADSIEILRQWSGKAEAMVSHRFSGDAFEDAFSMASRPDEAAKILVQYAD